MEERDYYYEFSIEEKTALHWYIEKLKRKLSTMNDIEHYQEYGLLNREILYHESHLRNGYCIWSEENIYSVTIINEYKKG